MSEVSFVRSDVYALKFAFTPQSRARRATVEASRKFSAWRTVVRTTRRRSRGGSAATSARMRPKSPGMARKASWRSSG